MEMIGEHPSDTSRGILVLYRSDHLDRGGTAHARRGVAHDTGGAIFCCLLVTVKPVVSDLECILFELLQADILHRL